MIPLPDFRPAWWLPHGMMQTLWMDLGRQPAAPEYRRETLATPDGDELVLDHLDAPRPRGRVVLLHGLEGHSRTPRLAGLARAAAASGFDVTVINCRGCATEPGDDERFVPARTPRLYYSGDTADLDLALAALHRRAPGVPLIAVAVSWGANTLLKWLGENPGSGAVHAAVAISPPYDLATSARHLESGMGPITVPYFMRTIDRKVDALVARFPEVARRIDVARVKASRSYLELDDSLWGPLHGFANAADFHARSSCLPVLPCIRVPTLAISSPNDPLNPAADIARARQVASPAVQFAVTSGGGHAAHFQGAWPWAARSWAEEATCAWATHWADLWYTPRRCRTA
jgi:predicted alpha/beta-fold hydrolase